MASFVDYQQNPLLINILPLFWFYNDTLDSRRKRGPKYGGEGTTLTLCGFTDKSQ